MAGIAVLWLNWKPQFTGLLVGMIRDKDPDIRSSVAEILSPYPTMHNLQNYVPELEQMLENKDPGARGAAIRVLHHLRAPIPLKAAISVFNSHNYRVLYAAFAELQNQGDKLSDDDALPLLRNPQPVARFLALDVLDSNREERSVELALPLLLDHYRFVRQKAAQTLQDLTGRKFSAEQKNEWIQWWDQNKAHFVPAAQAQES